MNSLHTLNVSARENTDLIARLLRSTAQGDSILLIENGVYNLTDNHFLQAASQAKFSLFYLERDAQARGLHSHSDKAQKATDDDFVAMSCQHKKVISWFV